MKSNTLKFTNSNRVRLTAALASCALFTAGCANMQTTASPATTLGSKAGKMTGSVQGGNQPVSGAVVTLYSVGQTGQGVAGVTLATTTTDAGGGFQFSQTATAAGDPAVPTALGANTYECGNGSDALLYIIAKGGNTSGTGTNQNTAAAFIAPVGYCSLAATQHVDVTEVTTAAMVAATGQFMDPASEAIGADGIGVAYVAIGHAFDTVATLVNQATGQAQAPSTKTSGVTNNTGGPFNVDTVTVTATPESSKLNTVANILASCVNQDTSTSGTSCSTLFTNAVPPVASHTALPNATFGPATDTIQAALYMFLNPSDGNFQARLALYNLSPPAAPFQPTLTSVPSDWTIGVTYTSSNNCSNTSTGSTFLAQPSGLAVDATGNIWISNASSTFSSLSALTSTGAPFACFTFGGATDAAGKRSNTTIDDAGNVWYGDSATAQLQRLTPSTGTLLTFDTSNATAPLAIAPDGADGMFFTGVTGGVGHLYRISSAATSTTAGSPVEISNILGTTPYSIFPDLADDMWVASGANFVTQVARSATGANLLGNYSSTNFAVTGAATNLVVGKRNSVFVTSGDPTDSLTVLDAGTTYAVRSGFPTAANTAGEVTPNGIYVDGAQNSWITDGALEGTTGDFAASVIGADGAAISQTGFGYEKDATYLNTPRSIVVDSSGNVWMTNDGNANSVTEFVGAGVPVYQPFAQAIQVSSGFYFQSIP